MPVINTGRVEGKLGSRGSVMNLAINKNSHQASAAILICGGCRRIDLIGPLKGLSLCTVTVLLSFFLSATATLFAAEPQKDNVFQVDDWFGYDSVQQLEDGTPLYEYVGEVASKNTDSKSGAEHNVIFRFRFLPRFQCSPLIALVAELPDDAGEEQRIQTLRNFNRARFLFDGEAVEFPALVERKDKEIHSFYNANLQRRTTLRILSELGNVMRVEYRNGQYEDFSLTGSHKVLEQALGRCKNHG